MNQSTVTIISTAKMFLMIGVLSLGCRPFIFENEDSVNDTESLPDPAPNGGCPDDYWDLFDNSTSPYQGGEEEILVEVSMSTDFHCPGCMNFAMDMLTFFDDEKRQKYVRLYYHHLPLTQHEDVWEIHYAAVAVAKQSFDKFWILHDAIYQREFLDNRMTIEEVVEFADVVLELDMDQFNEDRSSDETLDFIEYEHDQAIDQDLMYTPTVWVCGMKTDRDVLGEVVDYFLEGVD